MQSKIKVDITQDEQPCLSIEFVNQINNHQSTLPDKVLKNFIEKTQSLGNFLTVYNNGDNEVIISPISIKEVLHYISVFFSQTCVSEFHSEQQDYEKIKTALGIIYDVIKKDKYKNSLKFIRPDIKDKSKTVVKQLDSSKKSKIWIDKDLIKCNYWIEVTDENKKHISELFEFYNVPLNLETGLDERYLFFDYGEGEFFTIDHFVMNFSDSHEATLKEFQDMIYNSIKI